MLTISTRLGTQKHFNELVERRNKEELTMSVKAKFICNTISKSKFNKQDEGTATVTLHPVSSGSEENKEFWKYTPSGKVEMMIKNEAAEKYFEVGQEYYLTFEKAE
jgi:hypothetical protein